MGREKAGMDARKVLFQLFHPRHDHVHLLAKSLEGIGVFLICNRSRMKKKKGQADPRGSHDMQP